MAVLTAAARPRLTWVLQLGSSLAIAFDGCYAPDLRDCTVTCAATSDCAGSQVCGPDHFCAAAALAGNCASPGAPDASIDARHHPPPHADAALDAAPDAGGETVRLAIQIDGRGLVALESGGSCSSAEIPEGTECTLLAPRGLPATLFAIALDDQVFDRWTTPTCALQGATCVLLPFLDVDVGARFRKQRD
jgi:hypothetical protein